MIEAFRHHELIDKMGGRFKVAAFIQRRWLQFLQGVRPTVSSKGLTEMEVIVKEILEGKIEMVMPTDEPEDEQQSQDT